ncbi:MAG: hypothetical protein WC178_05535 [Candidatus Paceibacterota bacterium]
MKDGNWFIILYIFALILFLVFGADLSALSFVIIILFIGMILIEDLCK